MVSWIRLVFSSYPTCGGCKYTDMMLMVGFRLDFVVIHNFAVILSFIVSVKLL